MNIHLLIAAIAGMALAFSGFPGGHAKPAIIEEPAFIVIGISAQTTNAREMSGQGIIGKQWARVMKENLLSRIPNRADSDILALYTDYKSDANGPYTFIIGAKVSSADKVPSGMITLTVPAAKYAVFTSDPGPTSKVVPETWSRIWSFPKSVLDRAYKTDFELYGRRALDPQNAQVNIFVGVK